MTNFEAGVYIAHTLVRARGPHDDQAILAAIELASHDAQRLLPNVSEGERHKIVQELCTRYRIN